MQLKAGITALAERQLQRKTKTQKSKIFVCNFVSQYGTGKTKAVKRQIGITRANAGTK